MKNIEMTAVFEPCEEGGFIAYVQEISGINTQGETLEEANARVELGEMFTMLSVPHVNQVHVFYRAQLLDLDFGPGTESLEVALFRENQIPWKDLAFRTISTTLKHYYADRKHGVYRLHADEILAPRKPPA